MLRINLLPAYIAERRKTRFAIVFFSLLFISVTAASLAFYGYENGVVVAQEETANTEQTAADAVSQLESQAASIRAQVQPIVDKRNFVEKVVFSNTLRPRIYRNVALYTDKNIEYNAMGINGQTITMSAFAKNVSDIGRFLITMFGNPDLSAVSVSGLPGWQGNGQGGQAGGVGAPGGYPGAPAPGGYAGAPGPNQYIGGGAAPGLPGDGTPAQPTTRPGFPFTVTGTLIQVVSPPVPPGVTTPGAPGAGGFAGPPGGGPPGGAVDEGPTIPGVGSQ